MEEEKRCILYLLNSYVGAGHTFYPRKELIEECAQYMDVSREEMGQALTELVFEGEAAIENLGGEEVVMLWKYKEAEQRVSRKLFELCNAELTHVSKNAPRLIRKIEKSSGISLSERQIYAVVSSLENGVSVITGGPGTGKTTILKTLLGIFLDSGLKTALAAPTGRAAKRMQEATGEDAKTIHRLLEYYYNEEEEEMIFGRNEGNPLDLDCLIIDEMSMVDILLMDALVKALKPGTRLILVGDADQLPPVGAGSVLRDIIASETIHSVRLTDIFRQAEESLIIVNAHLINHGDYPSYNQKDQDFFLLERASDKEIAWTIKELCETRLPAFYKDLNPLEDIQVLTPTKKGKLGNSELNRLLQRALNPPSEDKDELEADGKIFRVGDKVIHNKNDYFLEWRDAEDLSEHYGVFNGDIGIITSIDKEYGKVNVLFDKSRFVTYDASTFDELDPAFALTVHKSQGSEFPIVVMPIAKFPPMLATRNLLYTAVTRAKTAVVLVGNPLALNAMVDNNIIIKRNSGLSERLKTLWYMLDA